MLAELAPWQWAVLAVAALVVGFAKTAIGAVGSVTVVLFASVLPARESTGAVLPVLIAGDLLAVGIYRGHADWRMQLFERVTLALVVVAAVLLLV